MLHKLLEAFNSTSASLQGTNLTLRQQTASLGGLVSDLASVIGAVRDNAIPLSSASDALILEEEIDSATTTSSKHE